MESWVLWSKNMSRIRFNFLSLSLMCNLLFFLYVVYVYITRYRVAKAPQLQIVTINLLTLSHNFLEAQKHLNFLKILDQNHGAHVLVRNDLN